MVLSDVSAGETPLVGETAVGINLRPLSSEQLRMADEHVNPKKAEVQARGGGHINGHIPQDYVLPSTRARNLLAEMQLRLYQ